ncbi:BRO family, N-terminal domain [Halopseudomonas pachastrellae]|uniref:BRO-N domain-containing protein n=1 Tax=Halopseudomonas pachastrellae TaxID=254161 RepID=UPI0008E3B4F5|nr:Bro-N domain-containing protein [Halopseudomonas pachastrellae]SFL72102.1 BRO family, N-terminal domain [Halopseudomonas pachastrellae]
MGKNSTAVSNVIPFKFEAREVRTLLIDDQPWFVASDVSSALQYRDAFNMNRNLDDDEKGTQIVSTPSGAQEMTVINESGLYSAILRSRKAEAKRFKKWVTAEVLPAIRKHGRYEDHRNTMCTLIGQTIGTDGFHCLAAVLDGKVRHLPAPARKRAKQHVWSQVHKAFSVVSAQDIPSDQMDGARNFIAAYAIEGEWLGKEKPAAPKPPLNIHFPLEVLTCRRPGMLTPFNANHETLSVTLEDLSSPRTSFCEMILSELSRNGYAVEAAWWEFRTYRNKFEAFRGLVHNLGSTIEEPQNYVVNRNPLPA